MAALTTNPTTTTQKVTRPNLIIRGRVTGAHGIPGAVDLQLTVALEAVVADDADPIVYDVYGVELRVDSDGRFADSYDLSDELRVVARGLGEVHRAVPTAGDGRADPHEGGPLDATDERSADRGSQRTARRRDGRS